MQPRSGESAKMEARRIFVTATGRSSDATRGGRHEAASEKIAEQFPGAVATQLQQHYICQLQGISSNYLLIVNHYVDIDSSIYFGSSMIHVRFQDKTPFIISYVVHFYIHMCAFRYLFCVYMYF